MMKMILRRLMNASFCVLETLVLVMASFCVLLVLFLFQILLGIDWNVELVSVTLIALHLFV